MVSLLLHYPTGMKKAKGCAFAVSCCLYKQKNPIRIALHGRNRDSRRDVVPSPNVGPSVRGRVSAIDPFARIPCPTSGSRGVLLSTAPLLRADVAIRLLFHCTAKRSQVNTIEVKNTQSTEAGGLCSSSVPLLSHFVKRCYNTLTLNTHKFAGERHF